jgi:hypothetical protein
MADHAPLCSVTVYGPADMAGRRCECDLINRVVARERIRISEEITDYMDDQWPSKPYSEGATYHSVRAILLEWTGRIVTHITKEGSHD